MSETTKPAAPAPVPKEVREALREWHSATMSACHDLAAPWADRDEEQARTAVDAAITRALADAREGALREAAAPFATLLKTAVVLEHDITIHGAPLEHSPAHRALRVALAQIRALASPPPAHEEGGR